MLQSTNIVAFVPIRNPAAARDFYHGVLGLPVVSEDPFALVLDANGITVRLANVSDVEDFRPGRYTVLGWQVADIADTVRGLASRGVAFARYPGMAQDELGIWASPSGAKVAWFEDPDGNILSLTEASA